MGQFDGWMYGILALVIAVFIVSPWFSLLHLLIVGTVISVFLVLVAPRLVERIFRKKDD